MQLESILAPYEAQYQDILKSEKAKPVRSVVRLFSWLEPNRIQPSVSIFKYMRVWDDAVEKEPYTEPLRELLIEEQKALLGFRKPTSFQDKYITQPLSELFGERVPEVKIQLAMIMEGLTIDLDIRYSQKPLTEKELTRRNFLVDYPPLAIFCIGKFGINPKPTPAIINTINDIATYDNVSDIFEDLPTGLILISQEDLKKYDLHLSDGQPLPTDKLMAYNEAKRKEVRGRLRLSSSAVFGLGLPLWFSSLLYLYYFSRSLKLFIPLPPKVELAYNAPFDAIGSMDEWMREKNYSCPL